MAEITLRGNPIHTCGELPSVGEAAPAFTLTDAELAERTSAEFAGTNVVLNIFPSIDTQVCAQSVRRFNELAAGRGDVRVLCVSADLPFAQKRFCGAEGLERVVTLSSFRHPEFADAYGVRMLDGPLAGLLARAVVVLDRTGQVVHAQLAQEPDYDAALAAL